MRFTYKCFLQNIFSKIPKGETLNYFFQKYVTKSLPESNDSFMEKVGMSYNHYLKFKKYNTLAENSCKYYEFGAGWDLIGPITMGLIGFEVTCIDIKKLVFNSLIKDTLSKFNHNIEHLPFIIDKIEWQQKQSQLAYLNAKFNLNYVAPLDAKNTKFESNYFDFAASTSTFEHIHVSELYAILNETYRILKPGGILSLIIDYQDHWAYFDKDISIYNFLKYDDREWEKYNPQLHYQNRLRHKDYLDIIAKTDFIIVENTPMLPSEREIEILKNLNINAQYSNYCINELSIKSSRIILKK